MNVANHLAVYAGTKAFNRLYSKCLTLDYAKHGVEVLTVEPAAVRSGMNSGTSPESITSEQHARAVVDKLGWEEETPGHWKHDLAVALGEYWLFDVTLKKSILAQRDKRVSQMRKERGQE